MRLIYITIRKCTLNNIVSDYTKKVVKALNHNGKGVPNLGYELSIYANDFNV